MKESCLKARILFRWKEDLVEFILAGDHDDIKRYLGDIWKILSKRL
ncbi:MAG: hypothetical protein KKB22_05485 [Candidatus Omnitrophica bacterium]|nr:hypothetical protein [Candidatus Omnitrophota bacterium]